MVRIGKRIQHRGSLGHGQGLVCGGGAGPWSRLQGSSAIRSYWSSRGRCDRRSGKSSTQQRSLGPVRTTQCIKNHLPRPISTCGGCLFSGAAQTQSIHACSHLLQQPSSCFSCGYCTCGHWSNVQLGEKGTEELGFLLGRVQFSWLLVHRAPNQNCDRRMWLIA